MCVTLPIPAGLFSPCVLLGTLWCHHRWRCYCCCRCRCRCRCLCIVVVTAIFLLFNVFQPIPQVAILADSLVKLLLYVIFCLQSNTLATQTHTYHIICFEVHITCLVLSLLLLLFRLHFRHGMYCLVATLSLEWPLSLVLVRRMTQAHAHTTHTHTTHTHTILSLRSFLFFSQRLPRSLLL